MNDEWGNQFLRDSGYWDSSMCQVAVNHSAAYDCPYFKNGDKSYIPCGDKCYYLKKEKGEVK